MEREVLILETFLTQAPWKVLIFSFNIFYQYQNNQYDGAFHVIILCDCHAVPHACSDVRCICTLVPFFSVQPKSILDKMNQALASDIEIEKQQNKKK